MAIAETANKSCGTCKDRRVTCDRTTPKCSQCTTSKSRCKGYGLRLSWPSAGNRRRSQCVKGPPYRPSKVEKPLGQQHIANVSFWDVQMHRHLTTLAHPRPSLIVPVVSFSSKELEQSGDDLIRYFHTSASQSLTTVGYDPKPLGEALLRIALGGSTPSAAAVFSSLCALASLHRHGVQTQAVRLKIAALQALTEATMTTNFTAKEVIQHAAAGMLLCSFEVHQASCLSSQWTWYISGVKEVLNAPCLKHVSRDGDLNALMDWVYYHDVMSRFTLRHWHGDVLEISPKPSEICKEVYTPVRTAISFYSKDKEVVQPANASMIANLQLLAELSDAVMTKPHDSMSAQQREDYKGYIRILDWRIRSIPTQSNSKLSCASPHDVITELFKLATLIYLNRVTGDLLDQADSMAANLGRAFTLLSRLESCERQFPLFIIGCEARTDEQRLAILDIISRTEKKSSSRKMNHIKILVQALWAQDDLADKDVGYWNKMTSVISSATIVPSFV